MKRIHVVAAVIECGDEILISRRLDHVHQGGKWEFPGGKLEAGESPLAGLKREIHEELDLNVLSAQPLIRISHDYSDKHVLLDVWRVTAFSGEPVGKEGQQVQWVERNGLRDFEFPAANAPIVTAVQLPPVYVVSPDSGTDVLSFLAELEVTLQQGFGLIQIRLDETLSDQNWRVLLGGLAGFRQKYPVQFMLNSRTAKRQGLDLQATDVFAGLHLTSCDLMEMSKRPNNVVWLAASCHSLVEIGKAEELGVDFITLSPVNSTLSHPDAKPLGIERFAQWVDRARMPVYGLGGLSAHDIPLMTKVAAQGVAGIRGFWQSLA